MDEQELNQTQETEEELTDEQALEIINAENAQPEEEYDPLSDEDGAQEPEEPEAEPEPDNPEEGAAQRVEDVANRARDEPDSADAQFARRVRAAYGEMTDEQIIDAMRTAQAERMHEEDPEISVKAAKMILEARESRSGAASGAEDEKQHKDEHAQALEAQAQEMVKTKEGAALLREMLTDETVKARIDSGEWDVHQARAYYEGKKESEAHTRKAPTTMKVRGNRAPRKSIEDMTDEEFEKFSERVERARAQGKRIVL